jgi:hypothetical protein
MTAQNPKPDDLRIIADNLLAEQHHSRAEVIYNAADRLELLEVGADKLTPAFAAQAAQLAALREAVEAAREIANSGLLWWSDGYDDGVVYRCEGCDAERDDIQSGVETHHKNCRVGKLYAALKKLEGVK